MDTAWVQLVSAEQVGSAEGFGSSFLDRLGVLVVPRVHYVGSAVPTVQLNP